MFQTFKNAWKIEDLRKRIIFTAVILLLFRLGYCITFFVENKTQNQSIRISLRSMRISYAPPFFVRQKLKKRDIGPHASRSVRISYILFAKITKRCVASPPPRDCPWQVIMDRSYCTPPNFALATCAI